MRLEFLKGRRKPYTELGIKRVPCLRCGKPSSRQWQICSLSSKYFGVCEKCDIELNVLVLDFFKVPKRKRVTCPICGKQSKNMPSE